MKIQRSILCGLLFSVLSGGYALTMDDELKHDIRAGAGVTYVKHLSDYLPSLAKTPGDSEVYVLEGKEKGGTVFVAGGTHGNEIAGMMAATILVERARVQKGRWIVLPHANNSAVSYADSRRPGLSSIALTTPSGKREFRYGSRLTKAEHQGMKDPEKYRHPKSSEELDGSEARNLDRAYPGKAEGNLTERMAYAILQLLIKEEVDVAFDLHESGPDSRLAWMVVANPKNVDTAAIAILALDAANIPMKLEPSSDTFRGLSHREWGDATKAQAFLFETPNPGMSDRSGEADVVNDAKYPLARRVGVHLATMMAILDAYNDSAPATLAVKIADVPGLPQLTSAGVGAFLK
jgi:predicted deacylase